MRNLINLEDYTKPRCNLSLVEKTERFRVLYRLVEQLTALKKTLRNEIVKEMGDKTKVIDAEGIVLANLIDKERESFLKKQFEIDYPGVYENYVRVTNYKSFSLEK